MKTNLKFINQFINQKVQQGSRSQRGFCSFLKVQKCSRGSEVSKVSEVSKWLWFIGNSRGFQVDSRKFTEVYRGSIYFDNSNKL